MLYRLGQNVLSRLILPLGEFDDKEKTRNIARSHNLPNAETADSQEICFIDEQKEKLRIIYRKQRIDGGKRQFCRLTRCFFRGASGSRSLHHRSAQRTRYYFGKTGLCNLN